MKQKNYERGFTLLELLVVMAVLSILLTGISMVFIETSRVARVQTQQAALQQNQRAAHQELTRMIRMAGAGGLPITWVDDKSTLTPTAATVGSFPNGFALSLTNNTPLNTRVGSDWVLPGSDMITVRGAFSVPVYYLNEPVNLENALVAGEIPNLAVTVMSRFGRQEVPLTPLVNRVAAAIASAEPNRQVLPFILRDLSNPNAYVIMELNPATTNVTEVVCNAPTTPSAWPSTSVSTDGIKYCVTIGLRFIGASSYTLPFGNLSMGTGLDVYAGSKQLTMPGGATKGTLEIPLTVSSIGLLEEFQYYLKADWQVPGDRTSRFSPVLSRAELIPGTTTVLDTVDISRDIIDLQVAVGIDNNSNIGGSGFNIVVDNNDENDEVLFNSASDTLVNPQPLINAGVTPPVYFNPALDFQYLRVTTVSQLPQPAQGVWVPRVGTFEDHDLAQSHVVDGYTYNFGFEMPLTPPLKQSKTPKAYSQSIIELRNIR